MLEHTKKTRIAFCDFWNDFNTHDNFIINSLKRIAVKIDIVEPNQDPDFLFYSIFGYENLYYRDCIRIYYTGENDIPDFNKCDYAISFQHLTLGDRHLRLPIYSLWPSFQTLRSGTTKPIPENREFCSFVVSNNWCASNLRTEIFEKLSKYKQVASGGRYANNIGGPVADKIEFLRNYKFNIAFENSCIDGYTTEKLIDALAARTVPIYWGNSLVDKDINPKCFINVSDFENLEDCIEYIKQVDSDDTLYNAYLKANPLFDSHPYLHWEQILDSFLLNILSTKRKYITEFGLGGKNYLTALEKEEMYNSNFLRKVLAYYKKLKRK